MVQRKKEGVHTLPPKGWPLPPFLMVDAISMNSSPLIVCERTVLGWRAIGTAHAVYPFLTSYTLEDLECSLTQKRNKRFYPWAHNIDQLTGLQRALSNHLEALKQFALRDGATPEAIRLLDLHQLLSTKEVLQMAAKNTEKKTPAAKKVTSKAPAKAKAPKAEAAPKEDTRKITVLTKENPYRAESKRANSWDALKGAKTVDDYKENGGAAKYIARWESEKHIKLS